MRCSSPASAWRQRKSFSSSSCTARTQECHDTRSGLQGLQSGVQDRDVSDALLLSSQRLEAERAIFQQQLRSALAELDAKETQAGP